MRSVLALVLASALAACGSGDYASSFTSDGRLLSSSGGEVELADGTRLGFVITSDRYKQWDAGRRGWGRGVASHFGNLLQPKSPTRRTIDRAVAYLESQGRARQAIERAGMSVRDFVLMTVALEQEMQLASGQGGVRSAAAPARAPSMTDSTYVAATIDSSRREVDTLAAPTSRDSVPPKRDTLWLKPPPPPAPSRDTLRDTTPVARDTMPPE
jgi:hypothetical protein